MFCAVGKYNKCNDIEKGFAIYLDYLSRFNKDRKNEIED